MKRLDIYKSKNMYGGSLKLGIIALIGVGVSFVVGALDGWTRMFRCR